MPVETTTSLGAFLKDRRTRMDPVALGFPAGRRRTPGLRREEVAQRANISPTWYTWLEQGRGGAPSADVLDRIAAGLMLTEPEREHLYMLGLGRPPEIRYQAVHGVSPRLQRVLDAFEVSPVIIKNATWDVIAWNRAAATVLTDYAQLPPDGRNILRLIFADGRVRAAQEDWARVARYVVGTFRADAVRAGASKEMERLVAELRQLSPEFEAMWLDNDVRATMDGVKRLHHPHLGVLELEFSTFAVEGRPELAMVVYNPATPADADRIRAFIAAQSP
ncbi:helix-turn-helix transcriptional regulator [Azorhizobium sp. AG788]|uniref:helix-turn-helix transcriptional regulator n=1 Tax=Azorhizobium sp. AG788 TaxID=2183897 RepID=UPI0031389143